MSQNIINGYDKAIIERGARAEEIIGELLRELQQECLIKSFRKTNRREEQLGRDWKVVLPDESHFYLQVKSSHDKAQLTRSLFSAGQHLVCIHASDTVDRLIIKNNLVNVLAEMQLFLYLQRWLDQAIKGQEIFFYHRTSRQIFKGSSEYWLGFFVSFGLHNAGIFLVPPPLSEIMKNQKFADPKDSLLPELPLLIIHPEVQFPNFLIKSNEYQGKINELLTTFIGEQKLKWGLMEILTPLEDSQTLIDGLKFLVANKKEILQIIEEKISKIRKRHGHQ